jgi:ABC-type enterochelin transport system permease subunit
MKLLIIIAIFTAIAGWFVSQSNIELANVFNKNHDDMHWIAAASMASLLFIIITIAIVG